MKEKELDRAKRYAHKSRRNGVLRGNEVEEAYRCKDGREVRIYIDDKSDFLTTVKDGVGREIGRFEFQWIDDLNGDYLKLCWAYLDLVDASYRRQGIGRECLKRVKEFSGFDIVAEDHDGVQREDGSHLTNDAPGFVAQMRREHLIARSGGDEAV